MIYLQIFGQLVAYVQSFLLDYLYLLGKINMINQPKLSTLFKNYQIFFKYDGHLNEFGNLSMFYDIISNQKINTKKNLNLFAINEIEKINKYYNQNKIN